MTEESEAWETRPRSARPMKVFFKTMAGNETFSIDADAQMTLSELRNAIGKFFKHDCEIILVLGDRELHQYYKKTIQTQFTTSKSEFQHAKQGSTN